jgi:MurNAc alpha-1-phosphate uridylyltransferase
MMMPVAILSGGLATRLYPVTEKIPKALVDINGIPFIHYQLKYLKDQGILNAVLCVGHMGGLIKESVGNGAMFGLKVTYSFDGPVLLGTGGALRKALPQLGKQFFVLYGDSFLPIQFRGVQEEFIAQGKPALMTIMENKGQWDKSNVVYDGGKLISYNKEAPSPEMTFIDYGVGVLTAKTLGQYPESEKFELSSLYHELAKKGQLAGHQVQERFYEIGSLEGLEDTKAYFKERHVI